MALRTMVSICAAIAAASVLMPWSEAQAQHGGHAFGIGLLGTTSTLVMPEFRAWLQFNGFG